MSGGHAETGTKLVLRHKVSVKVVVISAPKVVKVLLEGASQEGVEENTSGALEVWDAARVCHLKRRHVGLDRAVDHVKGNEAPEQQNDRHTAHEKLKGGDVGKEPKRC